MENGQNALEIEVPDWVPAIQDKLDEIAEQGRRIEKMLLSLGAPEPEKRGRDEVYEKTLAFMRANPIRVTALMVARNIGEDNTKVGTRIRSMISQGLVEEFKEDGQQADFKITPKGMQR